MERSAAEGKTEQNIVVRAQQRTDVVSYTLLAEMSYFHQQRVSDYNDAVKIFLEEQITYYQKVFEGLLVPLQDFTALFSFRLLITFSPPYPSIRTSRRARAFENSFFVFITYSFIRTIEVYPNDPGIYHTFFFRSETICRFFI